MESAILRIIALVVILVTSVWCGYTLEGMRREKESRKNSGPQAMIDHLDNIIDDIDDLASIQSDPAVYLSLLNAMASIRDAKERIKKAVE